MHLSILFNRTFLILFLTSILFISQAVADGMPESSNKDVAGNKGNKQNTSLAMSAEELANYQYCGRDSDCIEVINGCCQCLQGDKYVAIAKNRYKDFKMSFNCDNISCPKEESFDNCQEGVLSCINHKCEYFQPETK